MEYQKSQVRPKSDYEDLEEDIWDEHIGNSQDQSHSKDLELVSKESNHLAAILHVYAGGLIFMK